MFSQVSVRPRGATSVSDPMSRPGGTPVSGPCPFWGRGTPVSGHRSLSDGVPLDRLGVPPGQGRGTLWTG